MVYEEKNITYDVFETHMGWVAIVGGDYGILRVSLPEISPKSSLEAVQPEVNVAEHVPEDYVVARKLIIAYCSGEDVDLTHIPIDTRNVSSFFKNAWDACRSIPSGETRSYAWLAGEAGNVKAARGAGQAMARNKLALLVPCHRVVASSGALHGFGGDGLSLKAQLLQMEASR